MSRVSDVRVFTEAELLDLVRRVLNPLVDYYGEQGRQCGGAVEARWDKAHHIGCAQGLIYAVQEIERELGLRPALPRPEVPAVAPVSGGNRVAGNTPDRFADDAGSPFWGLP